MNEVSVTSKGQLSGTLRGAGNHDNESARQEVKVDGDGKTS